MAVVPTFTEAFLKWHYRSKDERLIKFSNHYFYDNRLVTFPSAFIESSKMDSWKLELEFARQMRVAEDVTGVPYPLILRAVEWQEPAPVFEHWKRSVGESDEEFWNRNFHLPDFKTAKPILEDLKAKGADPAYIVCVILWHIDDSKKYRWVEASDEDLKRESATLPGAKLISQLEEEILPEIERCLPSQAQTMRDTIERMKHDPSLKILHMESSVPSRRTSL